MAIGANWTDGVWLDATWAVGVWSDVLPEYTFVPSLRRYISESRAVTFSSVDRTHAYSSADRTAAFTSSARDD
jgi:hypothetical protein